jgi:non-ribosomal peptide synthetase component F
MSLAELERDATNGLGPLSRTEQRANRLARALVRLAVCHKDVIGIICCDLHRTDALVAWSAAVKVGAPLVLLPAGGPARHVADLSHRLGVTVFLACAEGAELWRTAGCRGRLIADAPDCYWWQLIEGRESPDPFGLPSGELRPVVFVANEVSTMGVTSAP